MIIEQSPFFLVVFLYSKYEYLCERNNKTLFFSLFYNYTFNEMKEIKGRIFSIYIYIFINHAKLLIF